MANGWGGARPGAGRKSKREKYAAEIQAAETRIKDRLPELIDNLFHLAKGGFTITRTKRERFEGRLIVVEEVTETALPDRKANEYLVDRILGRPTQEVEMDLTSNGETIGGLFSGMTNEQLEHLLQEADSRGAASAEVSDPPGSLSSEHPGD